MGRTKTFSVEAALDQAIVLFSQRGYSGASMQTISDRLGISRSSIYATFGDKLRLLEQPRVHAGTYGARRAPHRLASPGL